MGVHVLASAGETWLEQHSRALETYGDNSGDVSVKELVCLFL